MVHVLPDRHLPDNTRPQPRPSAGLYRAAATIDLVHDEESAGHPLTYPVLALWGQSSFVGRAYDVLAARREYATNLQGAPLPADHYLPEEAPTATSKALQSFLTGQEGIG